MSVTETETHVYEPRLDPKCPLYDPSFKPPAGYNPQYPGWVDRLSIADSKPALLMNDPHSTESHIYDPRLDSNNPLYDSSLPHPPGYDPKYPGWVDRGVIEPPAHEFPTTDLSTESHIYDPRLDPGNPQYDPSVVPPPGYDPAYPGWVARETLVSNQPARPTTEPVRGLTPYLGLKSRIVLLFIAPFLISIVFIILSLHNKAQGVQSAASLVKAQIISACEDVEKAAGHLEQIPTVMKTAILKGVEKSVNGTVHAAVHIVIILLEILEALIIFIVTTLQGLFLCLLQFVVFGGLAAITQLMKTAIDALNNVLPGIISGVNTAVQDFTGGMNKAIGGVDSVLKNLNVGTTIPTFSSPNLDKLVDTKNLIPMTPVDSLNKLNSSLPTLSDLQTMTANGISIPFNLAESALNKTLGSQIFNTTGLNTTFASKASSGQCNSLDMSELDSLTHDIMFWMWISTGIIVVLALLAIGFLALQQKWAWNALGRRVVENRTEWVKDHPSEAARAEVMPATRLMGSLMHLENPWISRITSVIPGIRTGTSKDSFKWVLALVSHPAPMGLLALAVIGILAVQAQIIVINKVIIPKHSNSTMNPLSGMLQSLTANLNAESAAFANDVNKAIDGFENGANDFVFNPVDSALIKVNETATQVLDYMNLGLNTAFGSTPLKQSATQFAYCLVGNKILLLQKAINWWVANVRFNMTRLDQDVLVPSKDLIDQVSAAKVGNVITTLLEDYMVALKWERTIFLLLLAFWGIIVVIAILYAISQARRSRSNNAFANTSGEKLLPAQSRPRFTQNLTTQAIPGEYSTEKGQYQNNVQK